MAQNQGQAQQLAVDEEKQKQIAYQIHENRQQMGKPDDGAKNWETAGQILESPFRLMLFRLHRPLIRAEKRVWEPILHWANNQAWLNLLSVAGNVGLIVAAASYVSSEKLRRDAEVFTAWQVITSADGQPGNGGRIKALEFLNASPGSTWRRKFPWICTPHPLCTWPAESLTGINLAGPEGGIGVYLPGIQLPNSNLVGANLQNAILGLANFQDANLQNTNLQGVDLRWANLQDAYLMKANLQDADLVEANLQDAYLWEANLQNANLWIANLQDADLREANLQDADLRSTNFQDADLRSTNFQDADLRSTNFQGATLPGADLRRSRELELEQLQGDQPPILCGTALPETLSRVDSNRDCHRYEQKLIRDGRHPSDAKRVTDDLRNKQWPPLPTTPEPSADPQ